MRVGIVLFCYGLYNVLFVTTCRQFRKKHVDWYSITLAADNTTQSFPGQASVQSFCCTKSTVDDGRGDSVRGLRYLRNTIFTWINETHQRNLFAITSYSLFQYVQKETVDTPTRFLTCTNLRDLAFPLRRSQALRHIDFGGSIRRVSGYREGQESFFTHWVHNRRRMSMCDV